MKFILLFFLLLPPLLAADTLRFSLQQDDGQAHFNYHFSAAGQAQQLNFSIAQTTLSNHFRQFRRFQTNVLQQYLWRDLQMHMTQYPNVRLLRQPDSNALRYQIVSADQTLLPQLQHELSQLTAERSQFYLQQAYYYQLSLPWSGPAIVPDHQRLMQDSLNDLLPVARALHDKLVNTASRDSVAYISSWLQQLPYQDLSDRQNSTGNTFSPPLRVLQENRGDCDSKTVLLAALLRMLLPDVKLAIVYLPQHAMLAVQLPVGAMDEKVTIEGKEYLLIDPTGPALSAPGQISQNYIMYTRSGHFGYRLL
ncbi:MAG: hypothetical protein CVV11_16105 [Gammaproteobacteria bacterium HGW-Gammaproteobacteria-15]|nr:MAG: hypothetical protein CVV11_16105 [Gammaproteobacteria bacterium HGW-Gammaproteobacteria-15]